MKRFILWFLISIALPVVFTRAGSAENSSIDGSFESRKKPANIFTQGRILLDIRTRYEYARQEPLDASNAGTIRTRLGYQTPEFRGFSGLIEIENTIVLDESAYDAFPGQQGKRGKTLIADPWNLELNRVQLSYKGKDGTLKAGRQRIVLDNERFVGNVGWRQNEQTFDAFALLNHSIKNLSFFYGYLDRANRIFGVNADSEVQRRFEMNTHLFNAKYEGCPLGKIGGYAYLIRVENAMANSGDTYGVFFDGAYDLVENFKLTYRAEYAYQKENSESPAGSSFGLDYYHFTFNAIRNGFKTGAGFEGLEGDGQRGFGTPLATGHKFNGWADVFLNTPSEGLEDIYVSTSMTFQRAITLGAVYHIFQSWKGNTDYGQELDLVGTWKINRHFKMTAKYADFIADSASFNDVKKFWMQLDINF